MFRTHSGTGVTRGHLPSHIPLSTQEPPRADADVYPSRPHFTSTHTSKTDGQAFRISSAASSFPSSSQPSSPRTRQVHATSKARIDEQSSDDIVTQITSLGISTQSELPAPPSHRMSGISDATLRQIGQSIIINLDELAGELGVSYARLQNYKATNLKTHQVTCEGTIQMLFEWREQVRISEQYKKLQEALRKARLIRIQEEFLP